MKGSGGREDHLFSLGTGVLGLTKDKGSRYSRGPAPCGAHQRGPKSHGTGSCAGGRLRRNNVTKSRFDSSPPSPGATSIVGTYDL
jgi:hypothetical protein